MAAVGAGSIANAATPRPTTCSGVSIGGAPWAIVALNVPCSSAATLLRKLAARPLPGGRLHTYSGIYLGMTCRRNPTGKKGITCGAKTPLKFVAGVPR
jgi:hypothetical protein